LVKPCVQTIDKQLNIF